MSSDWHEKRMDLPVYVVSLRHRTDRHSHIGSQLRDAKLILSFELRQEHESDETLPIELFGWQLDCDNPWWNRPLKSGEVDCFLSHLACWKDAAASSSLPYAVVLEDDAVLAGGGLSAMHAALERLARLDPTWDLLYFGRERLGEDRVELGEFVAPGYSYCTYAYAVSKQGLQKLLAYAPWRLVMPVDEFLPATFMPHPRVDVAASIEPTLIAYALATDLVTEAPKGEFGSDTEASPFICAD